MVGGVRPRAAQPSPRRLAPPLRGPRPLRAGGGALHRDGRAAGGGPVHRRRRRVPRRRGPPALARAPPAAGGQARTRGCFYSTGWGEAILAFFWGGSHPSPAVGGVLQLWCAPKGCCFISVRHQIPLSSETSFFESSFSSIVVYDLGGGVGGRGRYRRRCFQCVCHLQPVLGLPSVLSCLCSSTSATTVHINRSLHFMSLFPPSLAVVFGLQNLLLLVHGKRA